MYRFDDDYDPSRWNRRVDAFELTVCAVLVAGPYIPLLWRICQHLGS